MRRRVAISALAVFFLSVGRAAASCGDGVLEPTEECDEGSFNGTTWSCCLATCLFNALSPDVIVGDITAPVRYGSTGGITAYAIGTTSCNLGTCWIKWEGGTSRHPAIGQNIFRLEDGRFEQIGQGWLKHGIAALAENVCGTCNNPGTLSRLGVNCSDPYDGTTNGLQTRLGPKGNVNPNTGDFLWPDDRLTQTGDALYKRLQVHNVDLDPALNSGALYFVEAQYVTKDDANAHNQMNNASYRRVMVGPAPNFLLNPVETTQRTKAAIEAWRANDPAVMQTTVEDADGTFYIAAKATSLGGGLYHYEYAVHNFTNNRGARTFTVPIPPGATITNVGFHDVDYHSGDPFSGDDWSPTVTSTSVRWATQTYAVNLTANALRWGTLYNFRFDADEPPGVGTVTLGLFKPGGTATVTGTTVVPGCLGSPGDVGDGVRVTRSAGSTTIAWPVAAGSTTSSVLRGLVSQLPVGPGGGDEVCLETGIAAASTTDPQDPDPGDCFWYLVRGVNGCGTGTYGDSRQSTTCP
ncbi:MAG TPA: hypothetical protein VJ826_16505 [Candidatus Polarisedimenticolaceae bacterium]|nr:hypothetical protein [Candidatus Polarisedimenticolaceae bacterium]